MSNILVLATGLVLAACQASNFAGTSDRSRGQKQSTSGGKPGGPNGLDGNPGSNGGPGGSNGGPGGSDGNTGLGGTTPGQDEDTANGKPGTEGGGDDIKVDSNGLPIDEGGFPCLKKILPLHVVFAIDVTTSMDDQIQADASNVVQFAANVRELPIEGSKNLIPKVKIGAVGYVDSPMEDEVIELGDPSVVQGRIASLTTRGGLNDHCEGGLGAARRALAMLQTEHAREPEGSIPMLVVISDNYAHDGMGPPGARSFDSSILQQAVRSKIFRHMLLIDSVPVTPDVEGVGNPLVACPTAPLGTPPAAQWEPIRVSWRAAHPKSKTSPGRNVGFPFTANTILNDLPNELKRLVRVCD